VTLTYQASTPGSTVIRIRRTSVIGASTLLPQRLVHHDAAGRNRVRVAVARRGHPAVPGVYELVLTRPAAPPVTIDFRIVRK